MFWGYICQGLLGHFEKFHLIAGSIFKTYKGQCKMKKDLTDLVVSSMPVDGLATLGARPSAATVIIPYILNQWVSARKT